jgi:helix-turn-helix protein
MARSASNQSPLEDSASAGDLLSWTRDWGQLLRSARQVAGLSLADLSSRTGLSRGYLSKLESGQDGARNPSRATLVALARALPSFRPLAYQLEPTTGARADVESAPVKVVSRTPHMLIAPPNGPGEAPAPIQLGWRELEALVALLALERSATPTPVTARLIARAIDRPTDFVTSTLERLTRSGVLVARPPARPGADSTYTHGSALESRLGLSRIGDALILAAALLRQATQSRPMKPSGDATEDDNNIN